MRAREQPPVSRLGAYGRPPPYVGRRESPLRTPPSSSALRRRRSSVRFKGCCVPCPDGTAGRACRRPHARCRPCARAGAGWPASRTTRRAGGDQARGHAPCRAARPQRHFSGARNIAATPSGVSGKPCSRTSSMAVSLVGRDEPRAEVGGRAQRKAGDGPGGRLGPVEVGVRAAPCGARVSRKALGQRGGTHFVAHVGQQVPPPSLLHGSHGPAGSRALSDGTHSCLKLSARAG